MNACDLVFDSHVHVYPDAIGPRVTAQLASCTREPACYDGTRAGLLRKMAAAGIAGALNAPVATRHDQVVSVNTWAASQNRWPMLSLGSIHPDFPDIAAELRRVRTLGLHGIKLHPEYQSFTPDEPRMEPVWRACRELALPVLIHPGNDWAFQPPGRAAPAVIARVVRAWPGLTLIAAHFGGFEMWDEVERELAGLPLFLDTSFGLGLAPDEQFLRIIRRHGVARVLFGSDAPWQDPSVTLAAIRRLPLSPEEQHAILWDNARRVLGFLAPDA
jgi:predicted TIM-barrel fold metal-dependent hydrolase